MKHELTPQIEEALTYARQVLQETVSISKKSIRDSLTFSQHNALATIGKALDAIKEARKQ